MMKRHMEQIESLWVFCFGPLVLLMLTGGFFASAMSFWRRIIDPAKLSCTGNLGIDLHPLFSRLCVSGICGEFNPAVMAKDGIWLNFQSRD